MQFGHTCDLVMSGVKTQTRRVQQPGDVSFVKPLPDDKIYLRDDESIILIRPDEYREITLVRNNGRVKYQVGKQYAVQPGRGRKAGGRILLTGIRSERVQDITNEDALAEGVLPYPATPPLYYVPKTGVSASNPIDAYAELWDTIHTRPGERWSDNPLVWVLVFRLVEEA